MQAAGIDPYRYAPAAPQLDFLRDPFLWPARADYCVPPGTRAAGGGELLAPGCTRINRPTVPTIYPPVAQAYFLAVQEVSPPGSGSAPIQGSAASCAIAATVILLFGLRSAGRDPRLAAPWAWCPVVALEAGNNAHVDVLAAGLAAAALLLLAKPGRKRRSWAGGALLGLAVAAKATPVLVAPAVLKRRWLSVASAGVLASAAAYLPHLLAVGGQVIGFLPGYLREEGYDNGTRFALLMRVMPARWAILPAVAALGAVAYLVLRRGDPDRPWRGALMMSGIAMLITTPPYPWYSMLVVMLVALDGRAEWLALGAVKYLSTPNPLPFITMSGTRAEQIGYGLALALIAAVSLIRWRQERARQAGAVTCPWLPPLAGDPGQPASRHVSAPPTAGSTPAPAAAS